MQKLLLINCPHSLIAALEEGGCVVEHISVRERELYVPDKLAELQFEPDLILQQEYLGCRLFLHGLHEVDCIKIFWSVDTHMNMYWHGYYADLFDCVLTTQKKYVSKLQKVCEAEVVWMPWVGTLAGGTAVVPHSRREHGLTFVGRVTSQRRSRKWFVDFLQSQYDLNLADGLNFSQMLEIYRHTRIVPNEALFGEVNFRLFEAASCGCAVVTPNVGDELGELFEVGREIEVYNDVLELKEILDRLNRNPSLSGSMGMAAYARVLKDHLPRSRAVSILEIAESVSKRQVSAERAELLLCLSEFSLGESGDPGVDWDRLLKRYLGLARSEQRDAALLRISARSGMADLFMGLVRPYFEKDSVVSDCYFAMTASLCAVKLDQWDIAKHFWYAFAKVQNLESVTMPEDEVQLLMLWGDALHKHGLDIRSGVSFNESKDIPSCASDCYFAALYLSPEDKDIFRRLAALFRGVMGGEPSRLGFLSHLSLHHPDDWRISAEVGITNLKVFRMREGLTELENARTAAVRAGQERFFKRKLEQDVPLYSKLVSQSGIL